MTSNCTETCRQLKRAVADLIRIAQSDLAPTEKLELLCTQIGTSRHLLTRLPPDGTGSVGLAGPHFAEMRVTGATEKRSENRSG